MYSIPRQALEDSVNWKVCTRSIVCQERNDVKPKNPAGQVSAGVPLLRLGFSARPADFQQAIPSPLGYQNIKC